jgi:hypothetical protein
LSSVDELANEDGRSPSSSKRKVIMLPPVVNIPKMNLPSKGDQCVNEMLPIIICSLDTNVTAITLPGLRFKTILYNLIMLYLTSRWIKDVTKNEKASILMAFNKRKPFTVISF